MRRWGIQDLRLTGACLLMQSQISKNVFSGKMDDICLLFVSCSCNLRSQRTSSLVEWTTSVSCPDTLFRKLPPVPGTNSNYNTIDRIKKGKCSAIVTTQDGMPNYSPFYLADISNCSLLRLYPCWPNWNLIIFVHNQDRHQYSSYLSVFYNISVILLSVQWKHFGKIDF